jgi:integrase
VRIPSSPTIRIAAGLLLAALLSIQTHPDAGLHGLRHTFLTEAGEHTDPFTLQYVAGHDNIKTTMRYVHPQANAVQALFCLCDWADLRAANRPTEARGAG